MPAMDMRTCARVCGSLQHYTAATVLWKTQHHAWLQWHLRTCAGVCGSSYLSGQDCGGRVCVCAGHQALHKGHLHLPHQDHLQPKVQGLQREVQRMYPTGSVYPPGAASMQITQPAAGLHAAVHVLLPAKHYVMGVLIRQRECMPELAGIHTCRYLPFPCLKAV